MLNEWLVESHKTNWLTFMNIRLHALTLTTILVEALLYKIGGHAKKTSAVVHS